MNRSELPSPEAVRRLCGIQPQPSRPKEIEYAPRNPRLKHSERTVLVMPKDMLKAIYEYKWKHNLASNQAAMRKLLAIALGMEWEAELKGAPDIRPTSAFSAANRDQITARYDGGEKLIAIAADLGISKSYASAIKNGKR